MPKPWREIKAEWLDYEDQVLHLEAGCRTWGRQITGLYRYVVVDAQNFTRVFVGGSVYPVDIVEHWVRCAVLTRFRPNIDNWYPEGVRIVLGGAFQDVWVPYDRPLRLDRYYRYPRV